MPNFVFLLCFDNLQVIKTLSALPTPSVIGEGEGSAKGVRFQNRPFICVLSAFSPFGMNLYPEEIKIAHMRLKIALRAY